ncbi:MAG: hypothetical protein IRZ00_10555, partial [Gemmatimonadetes bacterium]|nr:hypothetical protein [Gemmatimonadota bacterium]
MATVSACAGAGRPRGPEPGAAPGEIIVTGPGSVYHVPLSPRTPPRTRTLARAAAAAWAAIPGAYAAAGIPVTLLDADGLQAGAIDLEVRGALGSTQVSAYLDCGIVAGALPAADRFLVTMTVLTTLRPLGSDSTDARIVVAGTARDATGTNPARVCASTGRLERALLASIEGAPQGMAGAPAVAAVGRPPGGAPARGAPPPP